MCLCSLRCSCVHQSPFLHKWDVLTMLCLIFTALVTPVEVAFLKTQIDTLFFINRVIDLIFVVVRASWP